MELALIPPVSLLNTTGWTNYQLFLPNVACAYPKYEEYYRKLCRQADQFVIMDNGAAESEQLDDYTLTRMALDMKVDELALPDVLGDSYETLKRMCRFMEKQSELLLGSPSRPRLGLVAQGLNWRQSMKLIEGALDTYWGDYLQTVYVPRLLIERSGDTFERIKVARRIRSEYGHRFDIHFFGMSPLWPREIQVCEDELGFVRGCDTSMPFNYTAAGQYVDSSRTKPISRPADFFELEKDSFDLRQLRTNLHTMIAWAHGGVEAHE